MQAATWAHSDDTHAPSLRAERVWRLGLSHALTSSQMWGLYLGWVVLLQAIGLGFMWVGAEVILGFAWLELIAVGGVLWLYAQRLHDGETIRLSDSELVVEVSRGKQCTHYAFNRHWVQVHLPHPTAASVRIQQGSQSVEIGQRLLAHERVNLARQLRASIQEGAYV